jgi:hypothetical protein
MSIPVALDDLRAEIKRRTSAPFLLTVSDDLRPHAVAVSVRSVNDALLAEAGRRTVSNCQARPLIALVWPPESAGEYSLIVDAEASVSPVHANLVTFKPTAAVLHRPPPTGARADVGACGADCLPLGEVNISD